MTRLQGQQNDVLIAPMMTRIQPLSLVAFLLVIAASAALHAQTYNVIYNFSGCSDGSHPTNALLMDRAGSLYGTTSYGGSACGAQGKGVAFRLKQAGSGWVETPLHIFTGSPGDGQMPTNYGGLTIGPDSNIYGTTVGGGAFDLGTVFRLSPPATACLPALCPWSIRLLHSFAGSPDGEEPYGNVVFDSAGNIFGTTLLGGTDFSTAYEMMPSGGGWNENVIANLGPELFAGLTVDSVGNLYGVEYAGGGYDAGYVFEMTPSGSGWTTTILYDFTGGADGANPLGGLVLDPAGNLYGSTSTGGNGGGTVFELAPSGGSWVFNLLYSFFGNGGPLSTLTLDAAGNVYGTTGFDGAFEDGSVFKLSRSGNNWTFIDLHDFHDTRDGITPIGGVTLDSGGNIHGTTADGGPNSAGVVWEITP
jgi:uncharacterized repeat protein (TIGR03803 family)